MRSVWCTTGAVFVLVLCVSCGGGGGDNGQKQPSVPPAVLDLVKQVVDQNGGTLEFNDANSAYNDLKITIPAGAMSQPVTITAEIPKNFVTQPVETLPVEFGPSGTIFSQPVTVQIPYNPGIVQQDDDPQDLMMIIESANGDIEVDLDPTIDVTNEIATSTTTHFSTFDVAQPRDFKLFRQPYMLIDSISVNYEIALTSFRFQLTRHPIIAKGRSNKTIELGKGTKQNFFNTNQGNVLIVHGLMSSPAEFRFDQAGKINDNDILAVLKQRQDVKNILLFQYQSGWSVESNAQKLADMIAQNAQANCRFTIIAHSMGGIVSRTAIEELGMKGVEKLITLGSPHEGGAKQNFTDFFAGQIPIQYVAGGFLPGLSDILINSPFLSNMNSLFPGKKPSLMEYYMVAGKRNSNVGEDGLVTVASATSTYLQVPISHYYIFENTDHNQLHSNARNNGVAVKIREWMTGVPNIVPVANAGSDQTVKIGTLATLTGTATDADGDPIIRTTWTQTAGTTVTLSAGSSLSTTFTPTVLGTYTFVLTANDSLHDGSDSVTVTVVPGNGTPIANAGTDKGGYTGFPVSLDGSGSSDPDNNPITYQWTQTGGTTVTFSSTASSTTVKPTFTPPSPGSYTFSLVVNDGIIDSIGDTVVVTIVNPHDDTFIPWVDTFNTNNTLYNTQHSTRSTWQYMLVNGLGLPSTGIVSFKDVITSTIPTTATILSAEFSIGTRIVRTSGTVTATDGHSGIAITKSTTGSFVADFTAAVQQNVTAGNATVIELTSTNADVEYYTSENGAGMGTMRVRWIQ